jgi:hypothetical protein
MSTASRNCGTVCSARGRWSNAPEVPGVSGKIRGHYDPRAARQLGSRKAWPKYEPEAEIAAFRSQSSAHKTTLSRRGARLRHSPPLSFPQPPPNRRRKHMRDFLSRGTPLAACPNLTCRRAGICHHLAQNGKCLKDNFASEDDCRMALANRINELVIQRGGKPRSPNAPPITAEQWEDVKFGLRKALNALKAENPEKYK